MARAVFLDRDGVINEEVYYRQTGEWEAPLRAEDFVLKPQALDSLCSLQRLGYLLFLVSNQPAYAKGKTSLEALFGVHDRFLGLLESRAICFAEFFYSYSHPNGVQPGFSGPSVERKPSPHFPKLAAAKYGLCLPASWMIGDRDTDILCGQAAGLRTIRVDNPTACHTAAHAQADFVVTNLSASVDIIASNA